MDAFNSGWTALMAGQVLPIAWCWKVTRLDGAVFGFTTAVVDFTFGGVPFEASSGFIATDIDDVDSLAVNNLQIDGMLTSDVISVLDIQAGRWDGAKLEIFYVNFEDLTIGRRVQFVGTLGNVSTGRISFSAEQQGLTEPLSQTIVELTGDQCRVLLGSPRCGVDLSFYEVTGTVGASPTNRSFVDAARTEPGGWFNGGNMEMTSGPSDGFKRGVKRSTAAGAIELVEALFFGLTAGDTYVMTPGCNHLLKMPDGTYTGDCKVKYSNVVNFQAEPETPGTDRITQVGGRTGNA